MWPQHTAHSAQQTQCVLTLLVLSAFGARRLRRLPATSLRFAPHSFQCEPSVRPSSAASDNCSPSSTTFPFPRQLLTAAASTLRCRVVVEHSPLYAARPTPLAMAEPDALAQAQEQEQKRQSARGRLQTRSAHCRPRCCSAQSNESGGRCCRLLAGRWRRGGR